jgi:hypothetical protein
MDATGEATRLALMLELFLGSAPIACILSGLDGRGKCGTSESTIADVS